MNDEDLKTFKLDLGVLGGMRATGRSLQEEIDPSVWGPVKVRENRSDKGFETKWFVISFLRVDDEGQ